MVPDMAELYVTKSYGVFFRNMIRAFNLILCLPFLSGKEQDQTQNHNKDRDELGGRQRSHSTSLVGSKLLYKRTANGI